MLTKSEILDFLKQNKTYFNLHFHIVKIGIFGSYARNEQTPESDIDIILEWQDNTRNIFHLKKELKEFLQDNFKRDIDICSEKWIKPVFRKLILKEVIYAE